MGAAHVGAQASTQQSLPLSHRPPPNRPPRLRLFILPKSRPLNRPHFFLGAQHGAESQHTGAGAQHASMTGAAHTGAAQAGAQLLTTGAQQVGSGAQQAAAGAQQVGSGAQHAAIGAQHVGSGAQHMAAGAAQVGAQQSSLLPQPPPNSPADANCEPANRQRAAVRVVHFIGVNSSEILREGSRVSRRYPASPIARATRSCLDGVRTCGPGSRRGSRSRPLAGRSLGRSQRQESDSRAAGRRAAGPEGHFVRGGPAPSAFRPDLPVDAGRPRGRSACTGWALSGWAACGPRRDRDGPHAVTRACPASPPAIPDHSPASGSPRGDPDSGILRDRRKMLAILLPTRWPRGGRPRNRPPFSGDPSRRRGGGPRQWPP